MQKLSVELKNTPRNASPVPCSVSSGLNKEETLSDQNKVLADNNPEENRSQHRGNSDLRVQNIVYVLNKRGKPLMPTKQQKANKLLKTGKSVVVKRNPFTIKLTCATGETVQRITLGVDAGYSHIGFSAVTKKDELISGEVVLRKDVSKRLTEKSMYRRGRRNRLWYREPRWLNRVSSKKQGWLAPSIKQRLESHLALVVRVGKLLPISVTVVEVANFDTQRMLNPEISGIKYQQGELQGYEVREYLLAKWVRQCAYCGKKNIPLEIEHIVPKSRGGSNCVNNLTLSCRACNQRKGNKTAEEFGYPEIHNKAKKVLRAFPFMNNIKQKIVDYLSCGYTYGYVTKHDRIKLGLEKSHSNDAFVIASGKAQTRSIPFNVSQKRKNNRCLQLNRVGFKPAIKKRRYLIQPKDLVKIQDRWLETVGCRGLGRYVVVNKKSINIKNVESVFHTGTLIWRQAIPPMT